MAATAADSAEGNNTQRAQAMTPEQRVDEIMREWHAKSYPYSMLSYEGLRPLKELIASAIAAEREACAEVAEDTMAFCGSDHNCPYTDPIAAAIRTRGAAAAPEGSGP